MYAVSAEQEHTRGSGIIRNIDIGYLGRDGERDDKPHTMSAVCGYRMIREEIIDHRWPRRATSESTGVVDCELRCFLIAKARECSKIRNTWRSQKRRPFLVVSGRTVALFTIRHDTLPLPPLFAVIRRDYHEGRG